MEGPFPQTGSLLLGWHLDRKLPHEKLACPARSRAVEVRVRINCSHMHGGKPSNHEGMRAGNVYLCVTGYVVFLLTKGVEGPTRSFCGEMVVHVRNRKTACTASGPSPAAQQPRLFSENDTLGQVKPAVFQAQAYTSHFSRHRGGVARAAHKPTTLRGTLLVTAYCGQHVLAYPWGLPFRRPGFRFSP